MWGCIFSLLEMAGQSPLPHIAYVIGTTVPALKLLISLFMGYPIAIIYHKYVKEHIYYRNIYFALIGLDMAFYNFGISMYHNLIPTLAIYVTSMFLSPEVNIIVTFALNMIYLVIGYIVTESEDYDITWTMSHCVLTLKLIALAFDLSDGQKMAHNEEISSNNKKTALIDPPTFIELIGFVYFPACFLVGPIFSFRRYKEFISDKFPLDNEETFATEAIKKLVTGVIYLMAFQLGVSVFSMKYMESDEFWQCSIFYRHLYCGLWAHFALYKYISCWLLTEASCIRIGLSYNGTEVNESGQIVLKWNGCNNIKLLQFEGATKFQHYIDSFNCNTNYFTSEYVYKRLKFLGNRHYSQFFALLFLALWHGTKSGYYMTFFNEFIIMFMEKDLENIISKTYIYKFMWAHPQLKYVLYFILKLYTLVFMGWSLAPFDTKNFSRWWGIYCSLYFSGFLLFLPWQFAYKPLLIKALGYVEPKVVKTD